MADVFIAGIGILPVGEYWQKSLLNLSANAIHLLRDDAGGLQPDALYVGNLLAAALSDQSNLGTAIADNAGLYHVETFTAEAGEASGAAAFRMGYQAVLSGYVNSVLVVGVEKYTDRVGADVENTVSQTLDYDFESIQGLTPVGQAGLLMRRYMEVHDLPREAFGILPMLAHQNALNNPSAMFHRSLSEVAYKTAAMVADPLNMYDIAPYTDGAAAVLLVNEELADAFETPLVRVAASTSAIDAFALHDRKDPLLFNAAAVSFQKAMLAAGMDWGDISLFEIWDSFSIYPPIAVEACGLAPVGEGWRWLRESDLSITGELPMLTMGGNKARGFPLAAAGVYQIVEAVQQLRGQAGKNQVLGAHVALIQSMAGPAANVFTHILEKV